MAAPKTPLPPPTDLADAHPVRRALHFLRMSHTVYSPGARMDLVKAAEAILEAHLLELEETP